MYHGGLHQFPWYQITSNDASWPAPLQMNLAQTQKSHIRLLYHEQQVDVTTALLSVVEVLLDHLVLTQSTVSLFPIFDSIQLYCDMSLL